MPSRRGFLAAGAGILTCPAVLRAGTDFLADATLRILIPNSAGSGQDLAARTFGKYLQARLPLTRVACENQTQANGRIVGTMVWEAPPDGLTLGFLNSNLLYAEILDEEELPYRMDGFAWVGSLSVDRRVMVVGTHTGIETVEQLLARQEPLLQAADGAASSHYQAALLVNALIGAWIQPVPGYNAAARSLALIRGEVGCLLGTWDNMTAVLEEKAARVLLRLNDCDLPPEHGQVPKLASLAALKPERAGIIDMIEGQSQIGRAVATTPGTPADRVARLQDLLLEVAADPAFVAEASANGLLVRPTPGSTIDALLRRLLTDKVRYAALFRDALACGQLRADTGQSC